MVRIKEYDIYFLFYNLIFFDEIFIVILKEYFLYWLVLNLCIFYRVSKYGVVGYRLYEKELFVFENGFLVMGIEEKK